MNIQDLLREQRERLEYWTPERIEQQRRYWERIGGEEMERARFYQWRTPQPAMETPPAVWEDDVKEV